MALSGSVDYNLTRDEIINGALRLVGRAGRGKTPKAADIADTSEALETMVKNWQIDGIHLWKLKQSTLFLTKGTKSYSLPGAHCTHSYVETDAKAAGVATDLTIDVDSITGMSSGDNIGIELDDGTFHWTTINGAPSGDTVTITVALPSAVAIDNTIYVYTTKIVRPLRAVEARRIDTSDVPIDVVSRNEYFDLPNKDSTGKVNQVYYDPKLTTGVLYVWPTGSAVDDKIEIDMLIPFDDFDASNNDPDFPQEWLKVLKWNLASDIGPEYGTAIDRQMYIDNRAQGLLKKVTDADIEQGSVYFGAAFDG